MKPLADGLYRILGEGAIAVMGEARRLEQSGKKVLHFEIGQPDFPTPPNIVKAAHDALKSGYTRYTSSRGIIPLLDAIQEAYSNRGIQIPERKL